MRIATGCAMVLGLSLAVRVHAGGADWVDRAIGSKDEPAVFERWAGWLHSARENVTNNVDAGLALATNLAVDLRFGESGFEGADFWQRVPNIVECAVILNIHDGALRDDGRQPTGLVLGSPAKKWTTLVLHEDRDLCPPTRPEVYSDYLLEVGHIAVVWVAADTNVLAGLPEEFVRTRLLDSQFLTSFKQLRAIAAGERSQSTGRSGETQSVLHVRCMLLEQDRIRAPAEISLAYDASATRRTFYNHEAVSWDLRVGLAVYETTSLKVAGGTGDLDAGADLIREKNTEGGFLALLEYHPRRDADRWLRPTWLTRRDFWSRFGVVAGLELSDDPLSRLYVGGSFAITHSLALTAGALWAEEDGAGAGSWFDKQYADVTWFAGLSISPGRVLDAIRK